MSSRLTPGRAVDVFGVSAASAEPNPYQLEWDRLVSAIREDRKHNEARRGAEASLVTAMGRMAAHTGQVVTYKEMLECEHELGPGVDRMTAESPAPLRADDTGKYPVPQPGKSDAVRKKKREF